MDRRQFITTAAAAGLVAAAGPVRAAAQEVRFVQSDWGFIFAPAIMAQELGYFKELGINATFTVNLGGAESLAAVIGSNAEINVGAAATALRARQKGTDATIFGASTTRYATNVVISREWATKAGVTEKSPLAAKLASLKGARIAVIGLGSGTHQLALYLAKKAGLDPDRDMTIVSIPNASALLAALQQGRIDGFVGSSPNSDQAVHAQGATMLFRMTAGEVPELNDFLFVAFIARGAWIKANPELARNVCKGVNRALHAMHDAATTNEVRDKFHAAHHANLDKTMFDEIWAATLPAWPVTTAVNPAEAKKVIGFLNEFGGGGYSDDLVQSAFDYQVAAKAG